MDARDRSIGSLNVTDRPVIADPVTTGTKAVIVGGTWSFEIGCRTVTVLVVIAPSVAPPPGLERVSWKVTSEPGVVLCRSGMLITCDVTPGANMRKLVTGV